VHTALGQQVEGGDALGDVQRMVVRQRDHAEPQADVRGAPRERGQHEFRLRRMRVAGHQVVLDQPRAVEAQAVGEFDLVERAGVHFGFAAPEVRRHGQFVEEIEVHVPSRARTPWRA